MKKDKKAPENLCPCGSLRALADCCGPYLDGAAVAPDAKAMMRSRYTAYVLANEPYLLATWHPGTRPTGLGGQHEAAPQWLGLTVLRHEMSDPDHAIVEFVARYKIAGRAHRLHEISRFERQVGRWYYLDGQID